MRWNDKLAEQEIKKYISRRDIYLKAGGFYEWLRTNKKLDHYMPLNRLTIEKCVEKVKEYKTKQDF